MTADPKPGYYRCTRTRAPFFTRGTVYEVFRYLPSGSAEIVTDTGACTIIAPDDRDMVPHDPWAAYKEPHP